MSPQLISAKLQTWSLEVIYTMHFLDYTLFNQQMYILSTNIVIKDDPHMFRHHHPIIRGAIRRIIFKTTADHTFALQLYSVYQHL